MIVLGVDPGVTTGFASISFNPGTATWKLVDRAAHKSTLLGLYHETIMQLDVSSKPEIAMEELLVHRMRNMDEGIEARGVVKLVAEKMGYSVVTYAPTTVRACVMGSGKATPQEIRKTIKFLCGIPKGTKLTDHEADAIAVALTHAVRCHGLILDRAGS
jgi:Holliday junction resolvasome RuvABC endonuclease subunit